MEVVTVPRRVFWNMARRKRRAKSDRSASPTGGKSSSRIGARALRKQEQEHLKLWESLTGRHPPFSQRNFIEQAGEQTKRAVAAAASERLLRQAASYEASRQFQAAAMQYQRAAMFKADEQQREAESKVQEKRYLEAQMAYKVKQMEAKREARSELVEYSQKVKENAEVRRQQELEALRERERSTTERLLLQAQKDQEEEAVALQKKLTQRQVNAHALEARLWKKADEERRTREAQQKLAAEREVCHPLGPRGGRRVSGGALSI